MSNDVTLGSETIAGAKELCQIYWESDIPTYMHGPPGVGKSAIFKQLAKEHGVGFIDIRLGTKLPEDLMGIPVPDLEKRLAVWLKAEFWPDVKRDGPKGIMLFDEMSDCSKAIQSCAYQVILDRAIGNVKLPQGWWPVAAGNRRGDKAAAQQLSTALANRFAHIDVMADAKTFVNWCNSTDINPLIAGFINFRPNLVHNMEGSDLRAFPSPRAWAQVHKVVDKPANVRYRLVRGIVGEGAAHEFETYMKALDLPDLDEIIKNPKKTRIPKDPSSKYALSSMLSRAATVGNFKAIGEYTSREEFGRDFEVVTFIDAARRDIALAETSAYTLFIQRNKDLTL